MPRRRTQPGGGAIRLREAVRDQKAYLAAYYVAHRDALRTRAVAYRLAHLEEERGHHAAHYAAHRDEDNARRKAYYEAHREKAKISGAMRYRTHREEKAAWSAGYYAANRVQKIAYLRAWRAEHPDEAHERDARHSAKRRGARTCDHPACLALVPVSLAWQTNPHVCWICGTPVWQGVNLHMDHVMPISRGGLHCSDNLRPACAFCNLSKHNRVA